MITQNNNRLGGWAKFLNPELLKGNLIAASMFLSAFETLKSSIVEQISSFYGIGFQQDGRSVNPEYQDKVLGLHKNSKRPVTE